MNHLDTLYRALVDYRKNTADNRECKSQRSAIITANSETDVIEITRKNCIVEEDWIEAIEKGLVFIEKAIKEERQFIRSNGEVIPIEKVKRTSKDSVEHLARHSNLFTREPEEGQDLIPDHLYTVERLSDFAVYENRFLYMLLCYLRDFIGMRYEKIVELTNTYKGNMSMNKSIVESNRRITYQLKLEEERKNDDYLREHNSAQAAIDRILTIYKAVTLYLATPLMVEVAKAPMLKPPVTRTNVLKMNRNFSEALKLYEFVTAYDKDGYEIKTEKRTVSPFVGVVADEIAETVELSLFLAYEHGLGIREHFKNNYEREEERRRREEQKRLAEQIRNISRHLKESGLTPEEYIVLLEKRIRDIEKDEEELERAKVVIENLQKELEHFKAELSHTKDVVRSLDEEIVRLNKKYVDDMAALEQAHFEKICALNEEHENHVAALREEHAEQIAAIQAAHEAEISAIQAAHEEEKLVLQTKIEELGEAMRIAEEDHKQAMANAREDFIKRVHTLTAEHTQKTKALKEKLADRKQRVEELTKQYAALEEQKVLADGRVNALRAEYGLMTENDDFSTKEKTDELEHQYKVFKKFFKAEWRKTKRKMWREIFAQFKKGELTEELKKPQKPTKQDKTQTDGASQDDEEAENVAETEENIPLESDIAEIAATETVETLETAEAVEAVEAKEDSTENSGRDSEIEKTDE